MIIYMNKEIVSFAITNEQAKEMMAFYLAYQKPNNGEYIVFQAEYSGVIITISVATKSVSVISYFQLLSWPRLFVVET